MGSFKEGGAKDPEEVHIEGDLEKEGEGEGASFDKDIGEKLPEIELFKAVPRESEVRIDLREKAPGEARR